MSRGPGQNPLPATPGPLLPPWPAAMGIVSGLGRGLWAWWKMLGRSIGSVLGWETGKVREVSGGLLGVQVLELEVLPASFHLLLPKFPW